MSRERSLHRRIRAVCLVAIGGLYLASVPWYRAADAPLRLWLGLPDWVAVALGCYVAVATLNAVAWLLTDVPDHLPDDLDGPAGKGDANASADRTPHAREPGAPEGAA